MKYISYENTLREVEKPRLYIEVHRKMSMSFYDIREWKGEYFNDSDIPLTTIICSFGSNKLPEKYSDLPIVCNELIEYPLFVGDQGVKPLL